MVDYGKNDGFRQEYGKYTMNRFEFESGEILNNVAVEYSLFGTPKYDDDGKIVNALVFCHESESDCSSFNDFIEFMQDGRVFDKNNYFIISTTALGFPDSCSPSTTGLKYKFPKYTIKDRVNFKKQFLKEYFNIDRVHGILGLANGGYDVLTWASTWPDEMDFIIVLNTSYKTNGYRYVISKGIDSFIESSEDFYSDVYNESLSRIMVSINHVLYSNYFSKKTFQKMTNDEIDVLLEDFVDEGLFVDIYDFKFRNDAALEYDVENDLKNIKAKSLIITSRDDIYYTPEFDSIPLSEMIEDSKLVFYDSNRSFHGVEDYSIIERDVDEFLKELKKEL